MDNNDSQPLRSRWGWFAYLVLFYCVCQLCLIRTIFVNPFLALFYFPFGFVNVLCKLGLPESGGTTFPIVVLVHFFLWASLILLFYRLPTLPAKTFRMAVGAIVVFTLITIGGCVDMGKNAW
jgi:hypothetical protein